MIRLILSLGSIMVAAAMVATGTVAFFSDTESSVQNTFQAGALDLLIDNESYYNGNFCEEVATGTWQWTGNAGYPVPGTPCTTSFGLSNLDDGLLFFDFDDVKPDDEGEDTISIHVQNDAWICMDLTLTSDDDNSSNEPELGSGDDPEDNGDAWDGELADGLQFFWWADDGDNVYEEGENAISDGVQTLTDLATTSGSFNLALADAENNVWGNATGTPVPGGETVYIAKAWCLGDLSLNPVAGDGGVNPSVDPGVLCDGTALGNEYQTDGVELNISFEAIQARHNAGYLCDPDEGPTTGTLTVNKLLTVSTPGIEVEDFELHINGPDGDQVVVDEVPASGLTPGAYNVYEVITGDVGSSTFTVTFGGACDSDGNLTLAAGDDVVCTINNVEDL